MQGEMGRCCESGRSGLAFWSSAARREVERVLSLLSASRPHLYLRGEGWGEDPEGSGGKGA